MTVRTFTLSLAATCALGAPLAAQGTPPLALPSCGQDLDALRQRIEADYPGYLLEIVPHPERYRIEVAKANGAAAHAATEVDCFRVLNSFANWFDDPHLFVYQSGRIDTAETARRARTVAHVALDEAAARAYFDSRRGKLDPVEGIWYDGQLRVAVVPENRDRPSGPFVAVVLQSDTSIWEPGAVRARLVPHTGGGYDADVWARNYVVRHLDAELYRGLLLRFSPGMWGKAYPTAPGDSGLIDPVDVHRATLVDRGGTIIVSIPSHDPTYQPAFDSLISRHATELRGAPRLIVDLRGNEGGSSGMTDALMPYILSGGPPVSAGYRQMMLLSSPDQIDYARRTFGPDTIPENRHRIARMEANPGRLVALVDSSDSVPPDRPDSVIGGVRRVGILIDRGTVSASEVMVDRARRSTRVTLFGENTAGALDYENVSIVPFLSSERRWYLGYPTITSSASLPVGGMRGKGIAPDVRLRSAESKGALEVVDRALRTSRGPRG